jgi:tetratricopeptide (TPR) repeat protein
MLRRYNLRVRPRFTVAFLLLSASMLAQAPPAPCPSDRPVDDIIEQVKKLQSKKNNRNKSPLPDCIFGWCRAEKTPPAPPPPAPAAQQPDTASSSSSRSAVDKCNAAMEITLEAAHNVEVGDNYFAEKKYKPALLRYQDAVEALPEDIAIHVRLGRTFEKLSDIPHAIEQYRAADKLHGPENWSAEARTSLARLQPSTPQTP